MKLKCIYLGIAHLGAVLHVINCTVYGHKTVVSLKSNNKWSQEML